MVKPPKREGSDKSARPVKPKPPLESEILRDICEALEGHKLFFWRTNNFPSLGRFGVDGKARFRAMPKFAAKGVADILCVKDGRFYGLEVKRPGAKLRPEQAGWGYGLAQAGGVYARVCSKEEALTALGIL